MASSTGILLRAQTSARVSSSLWSRTGSRQRGRRRTAFGVRLGSARRSSMRWEALILFPRPRNKHGELWDDFQCLS